MTVTETLLAILDEAFDRPPTSWAHFTDGNGESGYFGTLDAIDVHGARRSICGTSIASQTRHVLFAIRVAAGSIAGDADAPSAEHWRQSWSIDDLDSDSWSRLREDLRSGYADLRRTIRKASIDDGETFANIIGVIAHVAYHLGAIRCKARALAGSKPEDIR